MLFKNVYSNLYQSIHQLISKKTRQASQSLGNVSKADVQLFSFKNPLPLHIST